MAQTFSGSDWDELVRRLLLGTIQTATATSEDEEEEEADPSLLLWQEAATHSLLRRAARPWPIYTAKVPAPLAPSTDKACSWRSVMHLESMLKGHHAAALPEFIRLLHQHQRQLPPGALPQLLETARNNPELWKTLSTAIGPRGRWLARQHPDWRVLLGERDGPAWTSVPDPVKAQHLRAFRRVDASAARLSLAAHWEQFPVKLQARLLETLTVEL
ncbi:MAG: hypothetical protein D6772_08820, partial [Bacteroidetes bacterium]